MAEEQFSGNPFRLGTGFLPECLAGREQEQDLLREALKDITGPRKGHYGPLRGWAPQPLKIVGPRGAGKMALLDWVRSEAKPLKVDVVRLAFSPGANTKEVMAGFRRQLATVSGWRKIETQAFKYIQIAMNWHPGQSSAMDFGEVLAARLRFRPLLLLLDDIMHRDPKMLSQILHQSQHLVSSGWPLALVLVGTPALEAHLDDVDANFMHRANDVYINRLKPEATREALSKPFAARGVKVSDEALELMASWTDDYPYFIQTMGSTVWEAREDAARTEVDVALVQSVAQIVQDKRNAFYNEIYSLIDNADLLEHAMKAVPVIEAETQFLDPRQVRNCMAEGTDLKHEGALKIYNQLLDTSLFWEREDGGVRAAIPSFLTYFKKRYKQGRKHAKPSS